MSTHNIHLKYRTPKRYPTIISIMPPGVAPIVTLCGSNNCCLEQIFMVPKRFEPLKFNCISKCCGLKSLPVSASVSQYSPTGALQELALFWNILPVIYGTEKTPHFHWNPSSVCLVSPQRVLYWKEFQLRVLWINSGVEPSMGCLPPLPR